MTKIGPEAPNFTTNFEGWTIVAMLLGLANAGIPRDHRLLTPTLMAIWERQGVRCIATSFRTPQSLVATDGSMLATELDRHGISVAQYAGFNANLVHPDSTVRERGQRAVFDASRAATSIGAWMLSSGCGTTSPSATASFYAPHPDNHLPRTVDRLVEGLRKIVPIVEDAGLLYSLECHQLTTMSAPHTIREVLDRVDSPAIVANFDPVNLLASVTDVYASASAMRSMLDVVGERFGPSCHVKDVAVSDDLVLHLDECPPGEGVLDFKGFFAAASRLRGPTALIVEHLRPDESEESLRVVARMARDAGVELL